VAKTSHKTPAPPEPSNRWRIVLTGVAIGAIWGVIMWGINAAIHHSSNGTVFLYIVLSMAMIGGGVAAGVSVLLGDYSKAKAKTLRREFKLNIDSETISRERPPLKLSRGEVEAVYIGPFHSLRIVSTDSRRTIVVPGELEQRESALRDLLAIGLPLRSFSDWLADIALVRVAIAVTLGAAFISLWLPGPVWRLEIGSTVLLAGIIWDGVRVGGDPNVEYKYIGLERLLVVLAVLGVLWRDAHVLFDIWP